VKGVRLLLDIVTSLMQLEGLNSSSQHGGSFYKKRQHPCFSEGSGGSIQVVVHDSNSVETPRSGVQLRSSCILFKSGVCPNYIILIAGITAFPGDPMHMHRRKMKHVVATLWVFRKEDCANPCGMAPFNDLRSRDWPLS
jgi:hypothetical protein